ncbi:hypothetical protein JCM6292_2379 [Bacteroides pyogenes JCM 6292]|uniref:Uncharacterized protein n=2 Tax=Bacteroides pyogenes TaxID=310300 RepID=W4PHF9_9BACE|nr:hypothetical protein JCM6292_2379 [Bacteroides pyogenes JCM 6292]GAE19256.1 hypothetical protein JCM6294_2284 [Bacteroides pyogenes DSM 20611 = JCM 6294]
MPISFSSYNIIIGLFYIIEPRLFILFYFSENFSFILHFSLFLFFLVSFPFNFALYCRWLVFL